MRFEVFKRDSFTCQFCGAKAPDVILQIDHLHPVSKGGDNDILNLVTSCKTCNSGKGARLLSDGSVVERQRQQIEDLEDRRQQLEMILAWRDGLLNQEDDEIAALADRISRKSQFSPNDNGRRDIRRWLSKYSLAEIVTAIDISFSTYLTFTSDGNASVESWNEAFNKVGGIISVRRTEVEKPYIRDLFYIRGILRNRVRVDEKTVMAILEDAVVSGVDAETIKAISKEARSWRGFCRVLDDIVSDITGR